MRGTIGPLTTTRPGIVTDDVGAPRPALHSRRELALKPRDVPLLVGALAACLAD